MKKSFVILLILGILIIPLLSTFLMGCNLQKTSEKEIISANGTIKYIPLEGGFYGIETDKGEKYLPLNLPEEFKKDGLRVWFKAKLKEVKTIHMWGKPIEILEIKLIEVENLSQIRVAILYERITDGIYHPSKIRTYKDLVKILNETNPDLVFRVWWRWTPTPESLPSNSPIYQAGHTYQQLEETLRKLKKDLPEIRYWFGAIPTQRINFEEKNPITGKTYSQNETWQMALDPQKWGINFSKEKLQELAQEKGGTGKHGYFPDVTNKEFQKLYLSWAKRQIDAGVNGLFLDMLFAQPRILAKITENPEHKAVEDSLEAIDYLIKEIRDYGKKKGEYIYLCSFATFTGLPDYTPDLDFVLVTPTAEEVRNLALDEKRWNEIVSKIKERLAEAKILAMIDWAGTTNTPLGVFSQELSKEEQRKFLLIADEFFSKKGIIFVYPVHGGFMGQDAKVLSFGKLKTYDSLAPEFETYETIKELAQKKTTYGNFKERLLSTKVACWYQSITDYKAFNRRLDDAITHLKETNTDFIFRAFWKYKVIPETCHELPLNQRKKCEKAGYSYENFEKSVNKIKEEIPSIIVSAGIPTERVDVNEYNPITDKKYTKSKLWEMALDPAKWNIKNPETGKLITKEEFQFNRGKLLGFFPSDWTSPSDYNWREAYAYYPDITNPEFQELQLSWAKKMIDSGADAIWIDMLFAQARMFYELTKDPYHPAVKEAYEAALKQIDEIHKYAREKGKYVYVGGWTNFLEIKDGKGNPAYPMPDFDFIVNMIWEDEVKNKNLSEERWDTFFAKIKKYLGNDTLILIFMDEAAVRWQDQPLGIFSQYLNKTEQAKFLEMADSFFLQKREEFKLPITFVYPLHGGWMGTNAQVLSFGKFKVYDALAPEFETYETIKKLAQKKEVKPESVFPDWINEPLFEMIQLSKKGTLTFKEQEKMLPLLAEMGIKTVYLTPIWEICENPGSLKRYCIKDYYKIDPEKGTEKDLKEFVEKAHNYGMKVILDLVTAHTGPGRYIYEKHKDWILKDKYGRLALCWPSKHWGYAVDRRNPEVIEYFTEIAKHYVDKFGIDGWRVDAIGTMYCNESIPNCEQPVEGEHHSKDLLKNIKSALGKDKALYLEWCYLGRLYLFEAGVEEKGGCPSPNPIPCSMALPELNKYADASYSYEFGRCFMKNILAGKITSKDFVDFFKKECLHYGKPRGRFLMTHDFGYQFYEKNPEFHKLGAVLITTIPGFPHIYHREIFPEGNISPINQEMFNFYKNLLKIRERYKALKCGSISNIWKDGDNVIAYLREYKNEKVIVVINFLDRKATSHLDLSFLSKGSVLYDVLNNETFNVGDPDNFKISIPAYGSKILVLKRAS